MKKTLVLVGLMGSGKTRVGRELARLLRRRWVDLDQALVREFGPIPRQFERDGEAAFRRRESRLLAKHLKGEGVLSTGGGVVLDPGNRRRLQKATTVYLQAPVDVLAERLRGSQQIGRPLLRGLPLLPRLKALQRQRARFYRACASITVRAGQGTPLQIAQRICLHLKGFSVS